MPEALLDFNEPGVVVRPLIVSCLSKSREGERVRNASGEWLGSSGVDGEAGLVGIDGSDLLVAGVAHKSGLKEKSRT